jgi:hypothetical protein
MFFLSASLQQLCIINSNFLHNSLLPLAIKDTAFQPSVSYIPSPEQKSSASFPSWPNYRKGFLHRWPCFFCSCTARVYFYDPAFRKLTSLQLLILPHVPSSTVTTLFCPLLKKGMYTENNLWL